MKKMKTVSLKHLVGYLNEYLRVTAIPDKSLNGLQVEGAPRVTRVAFAVDACSKTIRAAARIEAGMLIVHHGLFWSNNERITGVMRERIGLLVKNNISLYAAHLPLDCHDEVGNNVELARILGLELGRKFADYHGVEIGFIAEADRALTRAALAGRIAKQLNCRVQRLDFGPAKIKRIGIVSGGAADFAAEAKELGCEAFVTGETSHTAYHLAREAGINVMYAGHYASETVGVKALARHLRAKMSLECKFISAPTGY